MPSYRVRQSKPLAAIGAVVGAGILVAGALAIGFGSPGVWLWLAFGAAIIAFNLWSAFGRKGHDEVVEAVPDGSTSPDPSGRSAATVTYRVRPSKARALLVAVFASVILVAGVVSMVRGGGPPVWFAIMFVTVGVVIVGGTLWSAFARNGRIQTIETTADQPPPVRPGQIAVRDDPLRR